ncbi:MAG: glycosyltransferase family 4 protein [Pseudonocardia sp.]
MSERSRRLRVAVIAGGWPGDSSHLEAAGREVDLTYYYSRWLPAAGSTEVPSLTSATSQAFMPLIKSPRGHLTFVFPGLHKALDRQRPDVVHVVSEPWGLLCVQAARWVRANPESALAFHGCDTLWHHGGAMEQRVRRAILRFTMTTAAAYCAENTKALALATQNGLPSGSVCERIHTCPRDDAVWRQPEPAERARARTVLELDDETLAVGLVGRMVPEKGIMTFLDAAELLLARGLRAKFFLVGDGPLRDEVTRRRSAHVVPLGSLVHPHGVLRFMQALDVLACPSRSTSFWEDQGPRAVLESMMCGGIPAATATGGIPEMLGGRGVLSRSVEPADFADAIADAAVLARNEDARRDVADWARSQYSNTAVARQLVDLWTRLEVREPDDVSSSADRSPRVASEREG